jgi:hypothetical protein
MPSFFSLISIVYSPRDDLSSGVSLPRGFLRTSPVQGRAKELEDHSELCEGRKCDFDSPEKGAGSLSQGRGLLSCMFRPLSVCLYLYYLVCVCVCVCVCVSVYLFHSHIISLSLIYSHSLTLSHSPHVFSLFLCASSNGSFRCTSRRIWRALLERR